MKLKNAFLGLVSLLIMSCSSNSKYISKTSSGEIRISQEKLNTSDKYITREQIISWGMEKPDGDIFHEPQLESMVEGAWAADDISYAIRGNVKNNPVLKPSDGIEEGFIIPVKEKGKLLFYAFVDDDFKKYIDKDFKETANRYNEYARKDFEKDYKINFKSIGNKIYMAKFDTPNHSLGFEKGYGNFRFLSISNELKDCWQ
jgi:hypothetical protein